MLAVFADTPTGNQYGPPSTSFSRAERLRPSGVRLRSARYARLRSASPRRGGGAGKKDNLQKQIYTNLGRNRWSIKINRMKKKKNAKGIKPALSPYQKSLLQQLLRMSAIPEPVINGPGPLFIIIQDVNTEAFEHKVSEKLEGGYYYPAGAPFIHDGMWKIALIKHNV
jgi:hypothetical protein